MNVICEFFLETLNNFSFVGTKSEIEKGFEERGKFINCETRNYFCTNHATSPIRKS